MIRVSIYIYSTLKAIKHIRVGALMGKIKAVIVSGSPRPRSNSLLLAEKASSLLSERGIETCIVELRKYKFYECFSCRKCVETKKCCIKDDMSEKIIPILLKCHIIIVSSPVYFDNVSGLVKKFIDRTWCIREFLRNKILGAIVVGRGYGLDIAIMAIYSWGLKHEMIICHRGVRAHAYNYGEVLQDKRALEDLEKMCTRLTEVSNLIYQHNKL